MQVVPRGWGKPATCPHKGPGAGKSRAYVDNGDNIELDFILPHVIHNPEPLIGCIMYRKDFAYFHLSPDAGDLPRRLYTC